MEIKTTKKYCIITPLSHKLGKRETERIIDEILKCQLEPALDMSWVKDCTIDFINQIKNIRSVSLFNINSDVFAILIRMNLDKLIKLYVSELDLLENKHQLINRQFSIV